MEAVQLANHCIPTTEWRTAPLNVYYMARQAAEAGIATDIGYHLDTGWFVLHSGPKPYLAWCELDEHRKDEGVVDASDIGLQAGLWPDILTYKNTVYRKVRDIVDVDAELEAVIYKQRGSKTQGFLDDDTLVVVND